MKPFNLEEALKGNYCVTRDGRKAKLLLDKRTLEGEKLETEYPILGIHQYLDGAWGASEVWTIEGRTRTNKESKLDLVGMWEDKQPEITVTIPAPLKEAKYGQEVWYLNYDVTNVSGVASCKTYPEKATFSRGGSHLVHLLGTGQLFATKEDCQTWLDVMKGARR